MDEKGFAPFAALGNVANRARVTLDEARAAVEILEGPDSESSDPENEGRRLERVPGGWVVLNAEKHRDLVTRAIRQAQTAERVRRHRALKRNSNAPVTPSEAYSGSVTKERSEEKIPVTKSKPERNNRAVTTSAKPQASLSPAAPKSNGNGKHGNYINGTLDTEIADRAARFCERYSDLYQQHRRGARYLPKPNLDWTKACELCQVWSDARLDMLATVFLKTDHSFAESGSRTIGQFAALASWCDDRLREVETGGS